MHRNLEQILRSILHASELLEAKMKVETNIKDLTSRQLYCIELIEQLENPSLTELAVRMNIAKASMSVMIDRLEKNGFIYKVTSDSDRRTAHVHLTGKGEKAASLHSEIHQQISTLLTREMTESEKEILIVLLNKAVDSLTGSGSEYF